MKPDVATPVMSALQATAPTVFTLGKGEGTASQPPRRRSAKRSAEALPPPSPALLVPVLPPSNGNGTSTPGTASTERAKRPRTSLKLTMITTEKPTVAPTPAEETAAMADKLRTFLDGFCKRHALLLRKNGTVLCSIIDLVCNHTDNERTITINNLCVCAPQMRMKKKQKKK